MKSLMSHSVCLLRPRDLLFGGGWRDPCNLSGVQLARQSMKWNIFLCLTYDLSDNLKIQQTFSLTTYINQKFWFHLCYIYYLCPYDPLNKLYALIQLILLRFFRKDSTLYCWLCMGNSLADELVFILMEFRNAQKYSSWK